MWMPLRLQLNLHLYEFSLLLLPRVKYHGIGNIYHCMAEATTNNNYHHRHRFSGAGNAQ